MNVAHHDCKHPIFLVGAARSGTTLLAAMLSAHSKMICGKETAFFEYLSKANVYELLDPNTWPLSAIEFLCSNTFLGTSLLDCYDLAEENVLSYLNLRTPSVNAILASVMEPYRLRYGKERWIEKTPVHLRHVEQIREYFPNASIIRLIRDPRAAALSRQKTPFRARTFYEACKHWAELDEKSHRFFNLDEKSYTLRYEALLLHPQRELEKLCEFLGEKFEKNMLSPSASSSLLIHATEQWKEKATQSLDKTRAFAWKKEISHEENRIAEILLRENLRRYQYECKETHPLRVAFYQFQQDWANPYPRLLKEGVERSGAQCFLILRLSVRKHPPCNGQYEIVDLHWPEVDFARRGLLKKIAAVVFFFKNILQLKQTGIYLCWTVHHLTPRENHSPLSNYLSFFFLSRIVHRLVVFSAWEKQALRRKYLIKDSWKISVVPLAFGETQTCDWDLIAQKHKDVYADAIFDTRRLVKAS